VVDRGDAVLVQGWRCSDRVRPCRQDAVEVMERAVRRQAAQRPPDDAGAAATPDQPDANAADPADGIGVHAESSSHPGVRRVGDLELVNGDAIVAFIASHVASEYCTLSEASPGVV